MMQMHIPEGTTSCIIDGHGETYPGIPEFVWIYVEVSRLSDRFSGTGGNLKWKITSFRFKIKGSKNFLYFSYYSWVLAFSVKLHSFFYQQYL